VRARIVPHYVAFYASRVSSGLLRYGSGPRRSCCRPVGQRSREERPRSAAHARAPAGSVDRGAAGDAPNAVPTSKPNPERKAMLKTLLYPALVVGVLGLQAGLQTVRGDEPDGANAQSLSADSMSTIIDVKKSPLAVQTDPQTGLSFGTLTGNTGSTGEAYASDFWSVPRIAITCSSVHMDQPHVVNATLEDNGHSVRIHSWAGWDLTRRAGPVWFNCVYVY
jgi:hypothetical protein